MANRKSFSTQNYVILTPPKAKEESREKQNLSPIAYLENLIDKETVKHTDFKKGKNFEKLALQLSI